MGKSLDPTYPKPRHHLHEAEGKYHPALKPIKTLRSGRSSIRIDQKGAPTLINEERNTSIQREATSGHANPNIPVHSQGFGDIFRQGSKHLEVLRGEVTISQRTNIAESFIQSFFIGEGGEEDEVEESKGENGHSAEDVGIFGGARDNWEILYILVSDRVHLMLASTS